VLDINLNLGEIRVLNPHIAWQCNYANGTNSSGLDGLRLDPFHKFSDTKNKLISIGCDTLGFVVGSGMGKNQLDYYAVHTCYSYCTDASSVDNSTECSGLGCCQTTFPGNISSFNTTTAALLDNSTIKSFSPCSYSFAVEDGWFKFEPLFVTSTNFASKYTNGVPLVLDWVVGNGSCMEASKMGPQYACQAMNSECVNVSNGPGYRCNCSQGYEGNPYLQGGCQGMCMRH
jgi:hypothetical protein